MVFTSSQLHTLYVELGPVWLLPQAVDVLK